jgi:Holliday junction DNA helicase RuvA
MLYFGDSRISSVFHQKSESLDPCLRRDEDGEFVMIGRLKGILIHKAPPWLVVDVQGVGYELEAPMSTFYDLPEVGREVFLFVHHAQKEDSVSLYGFLRESERRLFRDVQKVSGIGAKIALAVLSGVSVDEFARLLQASDVSALTRIPGIGKKTAERMVVELRDRAAGMATGLPSGVAALPNDPLSEAITALQSLGYKPADADRMARKAAADGDDAATIIRKALQSALR